MGTPTREEILARATDLYMAQQGGESNPGFNRPEENELKEGGFYREAQRELMKEGGTMTDEQREMALQEKQRLKDQLREVNEALGYKPRPKKVLVNELVQAAKAPAAAPVVVTVPPEVVIEEPEENRRGLLALPLPVRERKKHFPGRYIPELATQRQPEPPREAETVSARPAVIPRGPTRLERLTKAVQQRYARVSARAAAYAEKTREEDRKAREDRDKEKESLRSFVRQTRRATQREIILARSAARVEAEREKELNRRAGPSLGELVTYRLARPAPALNYSQSPLEENPQPTPGIRPLVFPSHEFRTPKYGGKSIAGPGIKAPQFGQTGLRASRALPLHWKKVVFVKGYYRNAGYQRRGTVKAKPRPARPLTQERLEE